jgi:adenylosuccinate synthase
MNVNKKLAFRVKPMIRDTVSYIHETLKLGGKVLVEGANGVLLDIDCGNYTRYGETRYLPLRHEL